VRRFLVHLGALSFGAAALLGCSKERPASSPASAPRGGAHDPAAVPPAGEDPAHATSGEVGPILELSPDAVRDLRLTIRRAEQRPAGDTLSALGSLEIGPNSVRAVSTAMPARVVSIARALGERIEAGEILVELESVELGRARAAAEAARSRVTIARGRLDLARSQRERIAELVKGRMATVREQQATESDAKAREADVAEAEVALRDAERGLALLGVDEAATGAQLLLRAPSAGVVIFRDGAVGDAVEAGHLFFRVADLSRLLAVVHPFERDGARVDAGASVRLAAAAHPGRSFEAYFLRAGPEVDPVARTLPVRLEVGNADGALRPGMSVTAEIRLAAEGQEVVTVPLAAVQRVERDWCVFIPRGPGRFERRAIARGRDLGGEVEVLSGLGAGEDVVVEGAFVLRSESTRAAATGDEHGH
jgi:membrane fusion protein, heavy metal efflux system